MRRSDGRAVNRLRSGGIVGALAVVACSGVLAAAVRQAEPADAGDPALWRYSASGDGLGHWLFATAGEADVRTPFGPLPADAASGRVPVTLEAFCREGEVPLELDLVVPPHPDEPATTRTLSLRNLWWTLTGRTPAPRADEAEVRIGAAMLTTAFVRPAVTCEWEPDYRAQLDAAVAVPALLRVADRSPLVVSATGRIAVEARFSLADGYRARLRQMQESCPAAVAAGR